MPEATETTYEAFRENYVAVVAEAPNSVEKGRVFATKIVTDNFGIEDDSENLVYCDGSGDGGIDIAYLDRATHEEEGDEGGDTWYLVQSKFGKAFQGTRTLAREARKLFDTLDGSRTNLSSLAEGLVDRLRNFVQRSSENDRLILVFATVDPLSDEEKLMIDGIREGGRQKFGSIFDVLALSARTIFDAQRQRSAEPEIILNLTANVAPNGERVFIAGVPLLDYYNFLKSYREQSGNNLDQLFEKNIRQFLGSRGKVNKAIQKTLKNAPEDFGLYNNGVTFVVSDVLVENADAASWNQLVLHDPYVVNGCQTTRCIWDVLSSKLDSGGTGVDAELERWKARAINGLVLARIVKVVENDETTIKNITRWSNFQNAVSPTDFIALTDEFAEYAEELGAQRNLFLEVQKGSWDARRAYQRQHPGAKQYSLHEKASALLKVYGAGWLKHPGTAFSTNRPFEPDGLIFQSIMEDDTFGSDDLYAAYYLKADADRIGFGRGAAIQASRRLSRFLFYYVAVDIVRFALARCGLGTDNRDVTRAIIGLHTPDNADALQLITSTALRVVDNYFDTENQYSIYREDKFTQYGSDMNKFLKSRELGPVPEHAQKLTTQLEIQKASLQNRIEGQTLPMDVITAALREIVLGTRAPAVAAAAVAPAANND